MVLFRRQMYRGRALPRLSRRCRSWRCSPWCRWHPAATNWPILVYSKSTHPRACMPPCLALGYALPGLRQKPDCTRIALTICCDIVRNVVSTVNLSTELKLAYINTRTRNSEYNPARFTGLIMRIRNPRATALIFRSGKLVCTGARCEEDSFLASKKFARIIQKIGFPVSCLPFDIHLCQV